MAEVLNNAPLTRETLEIMFGDGGVWDTQQLQEQFEVLGFAAPFCVVRRKSDMKQGAVMFQHAPRLYFDFQATHG